MITKALLSKVSAALVVALVVLALSGCGMLMGADGRDGNACIAYSWAVGPIIFSTNDPAFGCALYITNGRCFPATRGTYQFEYIGWDDSYSFGGSTPYISMRERPVLS